MDLNADLGEGFGIWRLGDDEALLDLVTSANVACGFHAGDAVTMRRRLRVGGRPRASPSAPRSATGTWPASAGAGSTTTSTELRDEIIYQIAALDGFCRLQGERVRYVKPHGALYNTAAVDVWQASAIVAAIVDYDRHLPVLCLPGSMLAELRGRGRATGRRRGVRRPGLPARRHAGAAQRSPGAVVSDVDTVVARAVRMATDGRDRRPDGTVIAGPVESLCVHGDTPGAVDLARRVREALDASGVRLAPFVSLM